MKKPLRKSAVVAMFLFAALPSLALTLACDGGSDERSIPSQGSSEREVSSAHQALSLDSGATVTANQQLASAIITKPIAEPVPLAIRSEITPIEKLGLPTRTEKAEVYVQLLSKPTRTENVVLHLRLPAPSNPKLAESLVRVIGETDNPVVMFQSDALAKLGIIPASPGSGFFSTFLHLADAELKRRVEFEQVVSRSTKSLRKSSILFDGRTPIAIGPGVALDMDAVLGGALVPLGTCPVTVASNETTWGESLLIRDAAVVRDTTRTWDACTGTGTPNAVWSFEHLIREMAQGSGQSPELFAQKWLETWLNDFTLNGDTVAARTSMFARVIQPWAARSGVTASLQTIGGIRVLNLSGPLDLAQAPFRLAAIVNRLDLGRTESGSTGYGGSVSSRPIDAGELRFVFGVQNFPSCSMQTFSIIFEYGVPITGCAAVRQWAEDWTELNGLGGVTASAYRSHLQDLTESVVVHGAAPSKGNQSALNQIRTNEIELGAPWELREFTLTDENPSGNSDTPSDGLLRSHTTAMTPDDAKFPTLPAPLVDDFVLNTVLPSVPSMSDISDCRSSFAVPWQHAGSDFRGANAKTDPPAFWPANVTPSDLRELCARHEFSLNTCNGCHRRDTNTVFLHVDPRTMPASISSFLTGGVAGSVSMVSDSQFGSPSWPFADLERRFTGLYATACTECGIRPSIRPDLLVELARFAGVVPVDPIGPRKLPFRVGAITDLGVVKELVALRSQFLSTENRTSVAMDDFARRSTSFVH